MRRYLSVLSGLTRQKLIEIGWVYLEIELSRVIVPDWAIKQRSAIWLLPLATWNPRIKIGGCWSKCGIGIEHPETILWDPYRSAYRSLSRRPWAGGSSCSPKKRASSTMYLFPRRASTSPSLRPKCGYVSLFREHRKLIAKYLKYKRQRYYSLRCLMFKLPTAIRFGIIYPNEKLRHHFHATGANLNSSLFEIAVSLFRKRARNTRSI